MLLPLPFLPAAATALLIVVLLLYQRLDDGMSPDVDGLEKCQKMVKNDRVRVHIGTSTCSTTVAHAANGGRDDTLTAGEACCARRKRIKTEKNQVSACLSSLASVHTLN